jgi:hypothetical protein
MKQHRGTTITTKLCVFALIFGFLLGSVALAGAEDDPGSGGSPSGTESATATDPVADPLTEILLVLWLLQPGLLLP